MLRTRQQVYATADRAVQRPVCGPLYGFRLVPNIYNMNVGAIVAKAMGIYPVVAEVLSSTGEKLDEFVVLDTSWHEFSELVRIRFYRVGDPTYVWWYDLQYSTERGEAIIPLSRSRGYDLWDSGFIDGGVTLTSPVFDLVNVEYVSVILDNSAGTSTRGFMLREYLDMDETLLVLTDVGSPAIAVGAQKVITIGPGAVVGGPVIYAVPKSPARKSQFLYTSGGTGYGRMTIQVR